MAYHKIQPLGPRAGLGTFETFCDRKKYKGRNEAILMNDVVVADFVEERPGGKIFIEIYHTKKPLDRHMVPIDGSFVKNFRKVLPEEDLAIAKLARSILHMHRGQF